MGLPLCWSKSSVTWFGHCWSFVWSSVVLLGDASAVEKHSPSSLVSPGRFKMISMCQFCAMCFATFTLGEAFPFKHHVVNWCSIPDQGWLLFWETLYLSSTWWLKHFIASEDSYVSSSLERQWKVRVFHKPACIDIGKLRTAGPDLVSEEKLHTA